jgi:hypothetical protein
MSHRIRRGTSSRTPRAPQDALFSPPRSSDAGVSSVLHPLPTDADAHGVMWAKWDALDARRLLLLGYQSGAVQVWDVTELDAVYEVLHLSGTFSKSAVPLSASVLPTPPTAPPSSPRVDAFIRVRPLLVVLLNTAELCVYSLASHALVKRVAIGSMSVERPIRDCHLHVGEPFVVVSTLVGIDLSLSFYTSVDIEQSLQECYTRCLSTHIISIRPEAFTHHTTLSRGSASTLISLASAIGCAVAPIHEQIVSLWANTNSSVRYRGAERWCKPCRVYSD